MSAAWRFLAILPPGRTHATTLGRFFGGATVGEILKPCAVADLLGGLEPDLTASVNLASQLSIPFYKLLGRRAAGAGAEAFYQGLVTAHFDWLASLPGRVCLCCDTAWERTDGERLIESRDALEGVALPAPDRTWLWSIAPRPEESLAYDRQNRVAGFLDFAAAWSTKGVDSSS